MVLIFSRVMLWLVCTMAIAFGVHNELQLAVSAKCEIILYLQMCTPYAPKKGVLHSRKEWIACRIACIVACRTVFVLLGKHDEQNFLSYSEVTPDKCFLSL